MTEHISVVDTVASLGTSVLSVDGGGLAGHGIHFDFNQGSVANGSDGMATTTATLNAASVARAEQAIGLKPHGPAPKATPGRDINLKPDSQNAAIFTKAGVAPTPRASGPRVRNYNVDFDRQLQLRKGPLARQQQRELRTLRRRVDLIKALNQKQVDFKPAQRTQMPRSMLKQILAKSARMTLMGPVVAAAKEVGLVLEKDDKLELKPEKLQFKLDVKPNPRRKKLLTLGL